MSKPIELRELQQNELTPMLREFIAVGADSAADVFKADGLPKMNEVRLNHDDFVRPAYRRIRLVEINVTQSPIVLNGMVPDCILKLFNTWKKKVWNVTCRYRTESWSVKESVP